MQRMSFEHSALALASFLLRMLWTEVVLTLECEVLSRHSRFTAEQLWARFKENFWHSIRSRGLQSQPHQHSGFNGEGNAVFVTTPIKSKTTWYFECKIYSHSAPFHKLCGTPTKYPAHKLFANRREVFARVELFSAVHWNCVQDHCEWLCPIIAGYSFYAFKCSRN